jgi:transposase-like protein
MPRSKYDDSTKAEVMAALLQGQRVTSIAEEYDIPQSTVSGWKKKVQAKAQEDLDKTSMQKKESEIGSLLVDYLTENIEALQQQAEQFSDEEWLREQDAAEVATLHGVMTDKAVRLLEALSGNKQADAE